MPTLNSMLIPDVEQIHPLGGYQAIVKNQDGIILWVCGHDGYTCNEAWTAAVNAVESIAYEAVAAVIAEPAL